MPLKTNNDLQKTTQKTRDRATRTPLKTNNDLQNTTQKTRDRATRTPLKTNNDLQNFCVVFCRSLFVFSGVRVARSLVFCVVFCRSLFVFSGVRVATRTPLKTNNDLQNTTQKTRDRATRTPLKTNNDLHNTTQKTRDRATGVRVTRSLVFCVVFCRSLFVFSGVRVAR
jgi:hypothetical protein